MREQAPETVIIKQCECANKYLNCECIIIPYHEFGKTVNLMNVLVKFFNYFCRWNLDHEVTDIENDILETGSLDELLSNRPGGIGPEDRA